jgi:hypothetical protein
VSQIQNKWKIKMNYVEKEVYEPALTAPKKRPFRVPGYIAQVSNILLCVMAGGILDYGHVALALGLFACTAASALAMGWVMVHSGHDY